MNSETIKATLTTTYKNIYQAMISKDESSLNELLADEFQKVHMSGNIQGKTDYIRELTTGSINYYTESTENVSIELHSDTATVKSGYNDARSEGWKMSL